MVTHKKKGNFRYPPRTSTELQKTSPIRKNSQIPLMNFQILSLRTFLVVSCPLYPPLQNYAVLGLSKTTPFWACPKRRRFGQNGVVLQILGFFLKKIYEKKGKFKKKKGKKKGEIGVAGATPCPKNGVAGPPHFWPRGGRTTPYRPYGGGRSHPRPLGVVRPPRKAKKKRKKKKEKNGFGILEVAGPPPRAWGWLRTPPTGRRGWPKPPPRAWGWSGHPQNPKPIFFVFFFGLSGWPDHPQRPGVASATPIRPVWGGRPPLGQKWGGPATPFFGQGVAPSFFFFFFLI
jgi:hypothetical protein